MEQHANDKSPGQEVKRAKPPWSRNTSAFGRLMKAPNMPAF